MKEWLLGMLVVAVSLGIYWLVFSVDEDEISAAPVRLTITAPATNSTVELHDVIRGRVSNPAVAEVWVVIHPVQSVDCWLQKPALVSADGSWMATVQFGKGEGEGSSGGLPYEVRALAGLRQPPIPGKTNCWPEAEVISRALYVKRN
ncbi:MAG: hypothetical protein OEZ39_15565 [Gammaproteobacteria bacterium]|nr:hypothetical protein [Gammaproteobacteria bacterium]MDH5653274.1 hypothetical protein [Gammaproteobacteria bacterium]